MGQHGGARENAGRKAKSDEVALIEKLSPLDDLAFTELKKGITAGEFAFIKLFFEYRHGKAKESKDITTNGNDINRFTIEVLDGINKATD